MIDLSVRVAGLTFKNPILPAASELVFDGPSAQRVASAGVGGIVTKTFTSPPEWRIRLRPYQFPLQRFDESFRKSGSFLSLASPHVEPLELVMEKNIPEIAVVCRQNRIPLIASFYERPDQLSQWKRVAREFERAGAQMIELNFSSPTLHGELERHLETSFKIVQSVSKVSHIPFGVKISPEMEPLVDAIQGWMKRGISFVTAHNAPSGLYVDIEAESAYGAPAVAGYLMGRPFLPMSLARVVRILKNVDIPVFGAGGISRGQDALQYLLCGCALVEIATAAYVEGTHVFGNIILEIRSWMGRKGYSSVDAFRGNVLKQIVPSSDLKKKEGFPYALPPEAPYLPRVNRRKCSLCGSCCRVCIYGAFSIDKENRILKMDPKKCWSCGFCVGVCPEKAITLTERARKRVVWSGRGFAEPFHILG